jgi:hypothetical protein
MFYSDTVKLDSQISEELGDGCVWGEIQISRLAVDLKRQHFENKPSSFLRM